MLGALSVFIVMNLIGTIPIAYCGYLIAYRNRRDLIAGYRESKYKYQRNTAGFWALVFLVPHLLFFHFQ